MNSLRILLVDDDLAFRKSTKRILEDYGWQVESVASAETGLARLGEATFDAILSDLVMSGMSGIEFLRRVRQADSDIPVVMVTGHGSIDSAVEAMKSGAQDYVTKPFNPDELKLRIEKSVEGYRVGRRAKLLEEELRQTGRLDAMIGRSRAMQEVFKLAARVAETDSNVIIMGETGTGKGLLARAIHVNSSRRKETFVSVNCAALTPTLLESELFGHEKGAFTGALERRKGRFELAHKGTLFLDEIAELNAELQTKLLGAVQERRFERVGGTETIRVDVRLITATNRNLLDAVRDGRFREDLYYRLNVVPITIPPLRTRPEDIEALAEHFLNRSVQSTGRKIRRIVPAAMRALMEHQWPGNVRELENTIERAVVLTEGDEIRDFVFEPNPQRLDQPFSIDRPLKDILRDETDRVEKIYLEQLLKRYHGNVSRTSDQAGIDRRTLFEKMKQYNLRKEDFK